MAIKISATSVYSIVHFELPFTTAVWIMKWRVWNRVKSILICHKYHYDLSLLPLQFNVVCIELVPVRSMMVWNKVEGIHNCWSIEEQGVSSCTHHWTQGTVQGTVEGTVEPTTAQTKEPRTARYNWTAWCVQVHFQPKIHSTTQPVCTKQ